METIFSFLLKASSGIALFYIVYWFFLRKETFYKANRWFLVVTLLTAVLLPLFPIKYTVLTDANAGTTVYKTIADTFKNIPVVKIDKSTSQSLRWEQVVLLVYLTVAAVFLLRILVQTIYLIHLTLSYFLTNFTTHNIISAFTTYLKIFNIRATDWTKIRR